MQTGRNLLALGGQPVPSRPHCHLCFTSPEALKVSRSPSHHSRRPAWGPGWTDSLTFQSMVE